MDEYKTKDLYEAAALYAGGVKLIRLEGASGSKVFVFNNSAGVAKTMSNAHFEKELKESTMNYADAVRALKSRVFAV